MKVFISHSNEDEALASKVVSYLEQAGLDVWYDGREIMPGDNWADKVGQGLRESEAMVVLVTPSALKSGSLRRDIDYALTQKRFKGRLVPVLAGDAQRFQGRSIPWIFDHLPIISLTENDHSDKNLNQIVQVLKNAA
jgi:hypothetical protein